MNTIIGHATRSPQVRRSSVPPCRPHTPCAGTRFAGISFALRLRARISALMADRFAWLPPSATARRFDAGPSDSTSRWTPCPPRLSRCEAAGVCPASCLRIPPARVRRDFHPQEKRPAGRTTSDPKFPARTQAAEQRVARGCVLGGTARKGPTGGWVERRDGEGAQPHPARDPLIRARARSGISDQD